MAKFSYRREFSPILGEILRPVAQVELQSLRGHWFPASMYIDSGADMTLVPSDFGKLLGMDLAKNRTALAGVTGSKMTVSLHSRRLRIGTSVQEAKVAVALKNNVPYLLGREGVFRAFKITFEEYKNLISFHRGLQKQALRKSGRREAAERIKKIREGSRSYGWSGVREIRRWRDAGAITLKGKKFDSFQPGFKYNDEKHEASSYLFGETKKTKNH